MAGYFGRLYDWLLQLFWRTEMDVTILGLHNAGKTTLLRVLSGGEFTLDPMPTVGFSLREVRRGHVVLRCWDLGGQPKYRNGWERYCRDANAIVYIVDSADTASVDESAQELRTLLDNPSLEGIALLVLGNKSDLPEHLDVDELIERLDLESVRDREVSCYGISAKTETNLNAVMQWLVARAGR